VQYLTSYDTVLWRLPGERFYCGNAARVTTWGRTIGKTTPGDYM